MFHPFWQHHNGIGGVRRLGGTVQGLGAPIRAGLADAGYRRGSEPRVRQALRPSQPARPRGATWNSRVNRDQVRDGAAILAFLMPVFVDVMMDNPGEDWGRPFYPVVQ